MPSAQLDAPAAAPQALTPLLALAENPVPSGVEYAIGGQNLAAADRETAAQAPYRAPPRSRIPNSALPCPPEGTRSAAATETNPTSGRRGHRGDHRSRRGRGTGRPQRPGQARRARHLPRGQRQRHAVLRSRLRRGDLDSVTAAPLRPDDPHEMQDAQVLQSTSGYRKVPSNWSCAAQLSCFGSQVRPSTTGRR